MASAWVHGKSAVQVGSGTITHRCFFVLQVQFVMAYPAMLVGLALTISSADDLGAA